MKSYIKHHPWQIIEKDFHPHYNKISESIFSIGNGKFGQRGMAEEKYSGETLQGSYVAGIYYPDKTRVGWWKNGYPHYFAKVLNAPDWKGIHLSFNNKEFDLHTCEIIEYLRVLDMQSGVLSRDFIVALDGNVQVKINTKRFCSMADDETAAILYTIEPLDDALHIHIKLYVDGEIRNSDSNYDEVFWNPVEHIITAEHGCLITETRKTHFQVATAFKSAFHVNGEPTELRATHEERPKYIASHYNIQLEKNEKLQITKYIGIVNSTNFRKEDLMHTALSAVNRAFHTGYEKMAQAHFLAWQKLWNTCDIEIEGDDACQQAIRFNIFQLYQTYTGKDNRLNIGPKGFTGEKYGGSTYWDTEAYCIPFYLATTSETVAQNLLMYRYNQLDKAIENAKLLGFTNGAALFPMVTMNGEECHNEWEITFEEIHRNGAIAFAIYNYTRYTGDTSYLHEYGIEVLIGIARFWAQRVNWSVPKQRYVMLGVTGPNEYENNVNNNWYTNYLAGWCLLFVQEALDMLKKKDIIKYEHLISKTKLNEAVERDKWNDIVKHLYYPEDKELGIFLQQEGYLDKEQILVSQLPGSERPLNQKWSWDRILRSCFIKQADVLQGLYFFEENFSKEEIKRNFEFYEPRTVHESSLSPCVHAILACGIGNMRKAYEMYLRTSRLDLDDYNNDTEDGCHITSMAGTWMSVVQGFGGMRVLDGCLHFNPSLPGQWESFAFNINFRQNVLRIKVSIEGIQIRNVIGKSLKLFIYDREFALAQGEQCQSPIAGEMLAS